MFFLETRTSTYINWKNPNVSSACFRKYVDSKNQNVATYSTWWIEFQVSTSFLKCFIFVKLRLRFYFFILFWLSYASWNWVARPFKSWADWELRRSAKLQLSQLWKFVLISLWVHVTNLKGLKRKCGRIQRKNQKSSVIVCRFYIHLFTVSTVNFLSNCCQWKEDW